MSNPEVKQDIPEKVELKLLEDQNPDKAISDISTESRGELYDAFGAPVTDTAEEIARLEAYKSNVPLSNPNKPKTQTLTSPTGFGNGDGGSW